MSWTHYLFGFHGRINRAPYWKSILVALAFLPAAILLAMPYILIEQPHANPGHPPSPLGIATIAAECMLALAYLVFFFAIMVKRLHDRDKSAWWVVPFFVAPEFMSLLVSPDLHVHAQMPLPIVFAVDLVVIGLSIWSFVELGCLRGTVGENRYGPDPLGGTA